MDKKKLERICSEGPLMEDQQAVHCRTYIWSTCCDNLVGVWDSPSRPMVGDFIDLWDEETNTTFHYKVKEVRHGCRKGGIEENQYEMVCTLVVDLDDVDEDL